MAPALRRKTSPRTRRWPGMQLLRTMFRYLVILAATVVVLLTLASLVYDVSWWYTKVLDFPRTQYLILALLCLPAFALLTRRWTWPAWLLTAGLVATVLIQSLLVGPYLIGKKVVPDAPEAQVTEANSVGILLANVLITNREADRFLELVR